jgi:DNA-binding NtrC family response regulator
MPLSVQVKMLRVLQDGSFSRVGSNETLSADVRIVTATNKTLSTEVAAGRFREDLYYRLNVVEIRLPPLRDRAEDIPLLAEFFLQRITRKNGMARIRLSSESIAALQQHRWPGNVRELENTIARACALASSTVLLPADIPLAAAPGSEKGAIKQSVDRLLDTVPAGENAIAWFARELAACALDRHSGDLKEAAAALGIAPAELRKILADSPAGA